MKLDEYYIDLDLLEFINQHPFRVYQEAAKRATTLNSHRTLFEETGEAIPFRMNDDEPIIPNDLLTRSVRSHVVNHLVCKLVDLDLDIRKDVANIGSGIESKINKGGFKRIKGFMQALAKDLKSLGKPKYVYPRTLQEDRKIFREKKKEERRLYEESQRISDDVLRRKLEPLGLGHLDKEELKQRGFDILEKDEDDRSDNEIFLLNVLMEENII